MNNIYDDTMNNNEPDYEGNLVFPPQEESVEQKLNKDIKILVNIIKKQCPMYLSWLEVHYKEYLELDK